MKTEHTGTHIEYVESMIIQESKSQVNALAFVDKDGHWIHIDKGIINHLYEHFHNSNNSALFDGQFINI